jgi:hypothetical protein
MRVDSLAAWLTDTRPNLCPAPLAAAHCSEHLARAGGLPVPVGHLAPQPPMCDTRASAGPTLELGPVLSVPFPLLSDAQLLEWHMGAIRHGQTSGTTPPVGDGCRLPGPRYRAAMARLIMNRGRRP